MSESKVSHEPKIQETKETRATRPKRNPLLNYFRESYEELKKVTWPTRNQAIRLTFIVIGFCIVFSVILGALDLVFNTGYRSLVTLSENVVPPSASTPLTSQVTTGEPTSNVDLSKIKVQPSPTSSNGSQQSSNPATGSTQPGKVPSSTQHK